MCLVKVYLKYIIILAFKKEKERDVVIVHVRNQKSHPSHSRMLAQLLS